MRIVFTAAWLLCALVGCEQNSPPHISTPRNLPQVAQGAEAQVTQPEESNVYSFVQEYALVLARIKSTRGVAQSDGLDMASCVRNMERFRIELDGSARALDGMRLAQTDDETRELLVQLLEQDASTHALFGEACGSLLRGPRPGVDLANISAQMPRITALIEAVEGSLYEMSAQVTMMMADGGRPNTEGRIDRLLLTNQERQFLLRILDFGFADESHEAEASWESLSAAALRRVLGSHTWKSADDP